MSSYNKVLLGFAAIGASYVGKEVLTSFVPSVYKHFLRRGRNLQQIYGNGTTGPSGTWVAVTGATGSLGFDYCREFAKRGFNILLIARNQTKAEAKIALLNKEFPQIETSLIKCDLSALACNQEAIADFQSSIESFINSGKDLGVLVNNAGIEKDAARWADLALAQNAAMTRVNIVATVIITQLLLPQLEKRCSGSKRRSLVVNIGSTLGTLEVPGVAIYSACKAFLNRWSVAASKEYEAWGVDITVTNPGGMESDMMPIKENILYGISSTRRYAESSMKQFGYGRTRSMIALWYQDLMFAPLRRMQGVSRELGLNIMYYGFAATWRKLKEDGEKNATQQ